MNYKFSDKKSAGSGFKNMPNEILAVELHKPIIKKKQKTNSTLIFQRQYLEC